MTIAECPESLRETLKEIICKACDGVSTADTCDWRNQGKFCEVPDKTVDAIHEVYYKAQGEGVRGNFQRERRQIGMTIVEAIEILGRKLNSAQFWNDPTMAKAVELGISALKAIPTCRDPSNPDFNRDIQSLPGETEK